MSPGGKGTEPTSNAGESYVDPARLQLVGSRYKTAEGAARYHEGRYGDLAGRLNLSVMRRKIARALARVRPGGRVLDVPCGTGQYTWCLAAQGFEVVAADNSPQMLEVAGRPQGQPKSQPEFKVIDIFNMPFPPASFDAALCIRFLHLLKTAERREAIRQLARVANIVVIDYSHKYTLKHFSRVLRHRLGLRKEPRRRFCRSEVIKDVSDAGMKLVDLIWVAPGFSEVWLAVLTRADG
jgi:SAM-dependent methyltransferase